MTEIQRYLAEEIAEDHADGLVSRREALRRLGLLGLGGARASCSQPPSPTRRRRFAGKKAATDPQAVEAETAALATRDHVPRARRPEVDGRLGRGRRPRGGVLVIHENRGLNDSIRAIAGRLAASGYSALAIDLLSEEGGTGSFADEFEAMAALGAVPPSRFVADMKAGVTEIRRGFRRRTSRPRASASEEGMTWLLLASKEPRLAAAVPFYGPFPEGGSLSGAKAAVLGIYAELDSRVNASRAAAQAALRKAGLKHQIVTYPDVDHAFFNPTSSRYDRGAATAAYRRMIGWFDKYVAT